MNAANAKVCNWCTRYVSFCSDQKRIYWQFVPELPWIENHFMPSLRVMEGSCEFGIALVWSNYILYSVLTIYILVIHIFGEFNLADASIRCSALWWLVLLISTILLFSLWKPGWEDIDCGYLLFCNTCELYRSVWNDRALHSFSPLVQVKMENITQGSSAVHQCTVCRKSKYT